MVAFRRTNAALWVAVMALGCACDRNPPTSANGLANLPAGLPPHRLFASTGAAVLAAIPEEARVIGFGEFHQRTDRPAGRGALAVFREEILPVVATRVSDLVLETWIVEKGCDRGLAASEHIEAAMKRPANVGGQVTNQIGGAQRAGIVVHAMTIRCAELAAIGGTGSEDVDVAGMLGLVTRELARIGTSAVRVRDASARARPWIALYGGALHNNRFPDPSVAEWSYAPALDRASRNRFVEIDLINPELVPASHAPEETWMQFLPYAQPNQVILYQRGERSFVVILPTAAAPAGS